MQTFPLRPAPTAAQNPTASFSHDTPTSIFPLYPNALERHEDTIHRACAVLDALGYAALADSLCETFNALQ